MKITDLLNEDPDPMATPGMLTPGVTASTPVASSPTNVQQFDPKVQSALIAQQEKNKQQQRKMIQDRIAALTKELTTLKQQLSQIK